MDNQHCNLVLPSLNSTRQPSTCHRTLILHSGVLLFATADVPEPPAHAHARIDIHLLSKIWDDSWPSWIGSSPLVINNKPVPLKNWRAVYCRTSHWKTLKQQWSKWSLLKFLMLEYQLMGPTNFWGKWSRNNGSPCSVTQILAGLKAERKMRDATDATAAKGIALDASHFTYRKGHVIFKLVTDKGIARKFRELEKKQM
ncbi:hypothetical protein JOM56_015456 [Amanita muscaria]